MQPVESVGGIRRALFTVIKRCVLGGGGLCGKAYFYYTLKKESFSLLNSK